MVGHDNFTNLVTTDLTSWDGHVERRVDDLVEVVGW